MAIYDTELAEDSGVMRSSEFYPNSFDKCFGFSVKNGGK